MNTKKELFGIELQAYLQASKKKKGEILNSLSRQTGMWRESIMRSFKRDKMWKHNDETTGKLLVMSMSVSTVKRKLFHDNIKSFYGF
ncbi:MAG: hypothetical protein AAB822_01495 [Patescibacteria group bacterium]